MPINVMGKITLENMNWGEWGTYFFDKFMKDFELSEDFMVADLQGYYSHNNAINDILSGEKSKGDSLTSGICIALYEFATKTVPHRIESLEGESVVCNPQRDNREGAQPSIPKQAPDIFKWILEGDENRGQAIISEFNQETTLGYDDHFAKEIHSRKINDLEAHAVSIVNKFPAYVRIMDDKLVKLLESIGFISDNKVIDKKSAYLKTIPFGLNFVSFPFNYSESLSSISVFELYATMKSTQNSLKRELKSEKDIYDVFFNIGCLAGGTIPRIHMQTYLRTKKSPEETYNYQSEGNISLKDFGESERIKLNSNNRNWETFIPQVKKGKYDIRLELKKEKGKPFAYLNDFELWDLSEILIYNSNILDNSVGISERNIQFFPTGVVIRPFAVYGGHENTRTEMIQGKPAYQIRKSLDNTKPKISKQKMYVIPNDKRGQETFRKLIDESSTIFKIAS